MRITQNSTFRRSFTAFFALVSLLGQGLHLLPGLGHDHSACYGCTHSVVEDHTDHNSCGHSHDHHGDLGLDSQDSAGEESGWQAASGHDCPICQFLARAQLSTATAEHIVSTLIWPPRDSVAPDIFTGRDSFEPHAPRGPPVDCATVT